MKNETACTPYGYRDLLKDNILKIALAIPVCFYTLGFLIHNRYLAKFNYYNFELLKGKYIYIGVVFAGISGIILFVLHLNISLLNPCKNFEPNNLFLWFFRYECLLLLFIFIFPGKEKFSIFDDSISIFAIFNLPKSFLVNFPLLNGSIAFIYLMILIGFKGEEPAEKENRSSFLMALFLLFPFNFVIVWAVLFNKMFQNIFYYVTFSFGMVLAMTLGSANKKTKTFLHSYFFDDKLSDRAKNIERNILTWVYYFILLVILVNTYSATIYRYLPGSFGGAKPPQIVIHFNSAKSYEALLLDETASALIIEREKEGISVINRSTVDRIDIKYE